MQINSSSNFFEPGIYATHENNSVETSKITVSASDISDNFTVEEAGK
ncbi:MAG: hypothetical protein LBC98_08710 [Prevotellaceae bacterium]|nr:hypothetical protein [Prevotellaceae bacterium]